MTQSAIGRASSTRRRQTALRITVEAQRLAEERGLDGFTLEELADAVGVCRRTLFNHVPAKLDAVLGPIPDLDPEVEATFVAGGPHGDLVEDVVVAARALTEGSGLTREDLERGRRLLRREPRLVAREHQRFDEVTTRFGELVLAREGEAFGRDRAQLLMRVLVATHEVARERLLARTDLPADAFTTVLADAIREVRDLFR